MSEERCRIGVVAPASRMSPEVAEQVPALAARLYPDRTPEIVFHPQCFASHGHFAGDDDTRARAFIEVANDPSFDAVWFARGGYGSCRMAEAVIGAADGGGAAQDLSRLQRRRRAAGRRCTARASRHVAHGPMAQDILRDGGRGGGRRGRSPGWSIGRRQRWSRRSAARRKTAAFNMTILSQLLGTPLQPDLAGHVLMLEEVGEAMYRIDRSLFHITSNRRDPAGGGHHARPLQRHHPERSGLRDERGGGRRATGASGRASPSWAAPTSATTSTTRSCRSGTCGVAV